MRPLAPLLLLPLLLVLSGCADPLPLPIGAVWYASPNATATLFSVQIPSDPANNASTLPLFVTFYGPDVVYGSWSPSVSPIQFDYSGYSRSAGETELWVPARPVAAGAPPLLYLLTAGAAVQVANAEVASALEDFAVANSSGNLIIAARTLAPFQKHWYWKQSPRRYVLYTDLCDFAPGPRQIFMTAYYNASVTLDALTSAAGCFDFDSVTIQAQVPLSYRRPVCPATVYFDPPASDVGAFVHVGARDPWPASSGGSGSAYRLTAWNNDADEAMQLPAQPELRGLGLGADLVLLLAEAGRGGGSGPSYSLYTSGSLDTRMTNQSVSQHRLFNHACFILAQAGAFSLAWNGSVRLTQPGTLQLRGFYASLPHGPASNWPLVQVLVTYASGFAAAYSATYPPQPLLPASQLQQWPSSARLVVALLATLLLLFALTVAGLVWRVRSLGRLQQYSRLN